MSKTVWVKSSSLVGVFEGLKYVRSLDLTRVVLHVGSAIVMTMLEKG